MQAPAQYKKQLKQAIYAIGKFCAVRPHTIDESTELCRILHRHGIPSTLGKFTKAGDDPAQVVHEYRMASDALAHAPFYLSVKPPALDFGLNYAAAITATAIRNGHGVHFDSHQHAQTDPTLQLLQEVMERYPARKEPAIKWRYGLTLPSRWKRSMTDARWAAEKGVRVRLVKGEFRGSSSEEVDAESGFLAIVEELAGKVDEMVVATEDLALAREAVRRGRKGGTAVQLELLFGMPTRRIMRLSQETGIPVGFYIPYGETLLVYAIHHFLKNPHKLFRPTFYEAVAGYGVKIARILASQE